VSERRARARCAILAPVRCAILAPVRCAILGIAAAAAAACAARAFDIATIPEPPGVGVAEKAASRSGTSDAVWLRGVRLVFQRDDAYFASVFPDASRRDVRIERQYSDENGRAVIVLTATETAGGDPSSVITWVRYRRVVGAGKVQVERSRGGPELPESAASGPETRAHQSHFLVPLLDPGRPLPRD
jgi:hypothetical protein